MKSVRIKYAKNESVKYVSHLDTLKTFTRAARRAELPLTYSKGFNPHPHMVFGLPSSVGMISTCEYVDIDFEDGVTCEEILERLNSSLPEGFRILECEEKQSKSNIMADIIACEYVIYVETSLNVLDLQDHMTHFICHPSIPVLKKSKKGEKLVDIKDMIKFISAGEDSVGIYLITQIAAGNETNLKPALLIEAINQYEGICLEVNQIIRTGMYLK